jgi:hypothetical protein
MALLGLIVVFIAALLLILDLVLRGRPGGPTYGVLTTVGCLLLCVALLLGVRPLL